MALEKNSATPRSGTRRHDTKHHVNHVVGKIAGGGVESSASGAPPTLRERQLGGAEVAAAPFGLTPNERRVAKCVTFKLEGDLTNRLKVHAATIDVSLESVVCLAWSLVLLRVCESGNVILGAVVPGLAKAVPMRIETGTRSAKNAAHATQESLDQIRASMPARRALHPNEESDLGNSFSGLFAYEVRAEHAVIEELFGGLWPLAVIAAERDETLLFSVWAQTPADPATVCAYMKTALERLAEAFEMGPDAPVSAVDVMPARERHKILVEWNSTAVSYPRDKRVHHLIEEQVARTPQAVALLDEGRQLTYSQLNAQANRLAHHLRKLGVGPEVRVAICAERSADLVIGLLAILKAGGAYVPLDPEHPQDRLAYLLTDCAPAVVLTQGHTRNKLPVAEHLPLVSLDGDAAIWADMPQTNPGSAGVGADDLAYVIYTSGSTGIPKGAMNAHRGVVNRLLWMQDAYELTAEDTVLQKTPFSFDVSVWEFFWPLLVGARLVMARPGGHKEPSYLCDAIQQGRVTTLHFVPSMLQAFLEYEGATRCRSLKRVICSGEALPAVLVRRFHERLPGCELHNLYGPTEAAVDVTAWKCGDAAAATSIPIGRPIANTRIYILAAHGEPVPVGVAGEIFIAGVQVGRGYLNRPDLTAERFVSDPFCADPAARMYKTGDLGRWTADGVIEYLGRNDFQVKIRGFRIELGEIEAQLMGHQAVREAVVLARGEGDEKRLVAYYVSDGHIALESLRAHLSARLPEYMVPAAYVRLEAMPLSSNGKLERKALPAPGSDAYSEDAFEAPEGSVEKKLAEIWERLLGLERLSRHANFFDVGGHSLLAVRMLTRIEEEFGRSLDLTCLFKAPTISSLGRLLAHQTTAPGSLQVVSIQPDGEEPPLFSILTPLRYRNIAANLGANQPVIGLELFNPAMPLEKRFSRLEDAAAECVRLIREIQPHGPYAMIGWCAAGVVAFETAQQLVKLGEEVSFVGVVDGWAPDYLRRRGGDLWLKGIDFASRCKRAYSAICTGRQTPRTLLSKLWNWILRRPPAEFDPFNSDPGLQAIVRSDGEMWAYLWKLQGAYRPVPFEGRVHIFVSQYRPTGWLADSSLGWQGLATAGVEVVPYQGEHWAIFDEPAARRAAEIIAAGLQGRSVRAAAKSSGSASVRANDLPARPLVSVVIPAYNAEKDIAQAIRCAMSQTYPEIEIIVIDDASQDETVQTARSVLEKSCKGRWSVLELHVNQGAAAARNIAVKQAHGEWIQFLDSDDAIAADKIEAQMEHAQGAGPEVAAIYSSWRHVYLEDQNFVPVGPVNTPRYEGKHPLMFCMYYAPLHHGACLIRRSALERVQGFNEGMRSYEDADLLVRLAKQSGRFQFVPLSTPSYLWRLYKEQVREGGANARYKLEETAMNWLKVVREAAGERQVQDILSSPDELLVWRQHCTSYARRLFESDPDAFTLFMDKLQPLDPDFSYRPTREARSRTHEARVGCES